MIRRPHHLAQVQQLLSNNPVVALLGARQVGKTTLAREIVNEASGSCTFFDLEDPRHVARLSDPMLTLEPLKGLVVLDEIQRRPELFPVLRVLADRSNVPARFLVLGSASPDLLKQASESLAGRIAFQELPRFSLAEVGPANLDRLWLRGGFPRAYLTDRLPDSVRWRRDFIRTFLERDLPQLGITIAASTLRRFWSMVAHYHGQVWNASEFARSFGVADTTVRRYLDILTATFMLRLLPPWTENLRKRQVKAPKLYVADSGLLHTLLDLTEKRDLEGHPKLGASWEGFLLEEVILQLGAQPEQCYFWATHAGAELDLLVVRGRERYGFEFKRTVAPTLSRSMHTAIADLTLTRLDLIYAGQETFPLAPQVRAVAAARLTEDIEPFDR